MNGNPMPQISGFNYSRYKNTSDITWRAAMDIALEKARAAQSEGGQLCLQFED